MLIEDEDFYFNEQGLMVFTKAYHLKRGKCCKNKCLHCPWLYGREKNADNRTGEAQPPEDK